MLESVRDENGCMADRLHDVGDVGVCDRRVEPAFDDGRTAVRRAVEAAAERQRKAVEARQNGSERRWKHGRTTVKDSVSPGSVDSAMNSHSDICRTAAGGGGGGEREYENTIERVRFLIGRAERRGRCDF